MWTITRLKNLSGVYVECYRFSIFVATDSVYYKYQYRLTYTFVVIWIAYRVYEKNEIIEQRIQNHWNFAVVLNGSQLAWCDVWAKRVSQGKLANQRPFKTASINFWSRSFILLFRFSHIHLNDYLQITIYCHLLIFSL